MGTSNIHAPCSPGFTSKRAPLIPTESQDIDEDIYDDTLAVTGDHGGDNGGEDIYDDTVPATSEMYVHNPITCTCMYTVPYFL